MKKFLINFYISPFTVIYIGLSLVLGRFYYLFIHLFVALIHELSHVLMAISLKMKVKEIEVLPFGFYASFDDLESYHPLKQILVLISGLLSIFLSLAILKVLYKFNILSVYGYNHGIEVSINVLLFNLFPIYPLDGNRIIYAFLSYFFEESKTRILTCLISLAFCLFMTIYLMRINQIVIAVFLLINAIKHPLFSYQNYMNFLLLRRYDKEKRKVKISSKIRLFRHYDNYYFKDNNLYGENFIVEKKIIDLAKTKKTFIKNLRC